MKSVPVNPLISALAAGQQAAYAALYDRLAGSLLRVACTMFGSAAGRGEAEDAVQDVFVELVRSRHRLEQIADLDAYLFSMLRNGVRRRQKCRKSEVDKLRRLVPAAAAETCEMAGADLEQAMAKLPAEQREVIALKIDGGLTFEQIGEVLGVSLNTAASRYRYALEKLKKMLE